MRADLALTTLNLAKSRTHAQDLIKEGVVYYNDQLIKKPSQEIQDINKIKVLKETIYVSRGAYKLLSALEIFPIELKNKVVADIGASTGGFTEVSLLNGAKKVYAIDVGHDQLAAKLKSDERVINLEGVNIKHGISLDELVDVVVADLSFISLKLVIIEMMKLVNLGGDAIVLVKPQFEVGPSGIGKNGIVKEGYYTRNAILSLCDFLQENQIALIDFSKCGIEGKDGNQEYFFHLKPKGNSSLTKEDLIKKFEEYKI